MIHALGVDSPIYTIVGAIFLVALIFAIYCLRPRKKTGLRFCVYVDVNLVSANTKYIMRYDGIVSKEEAAHIFSHGYESKILKTLKSKKVKKINYVTACDCLLQYDVYSESKRKKATFITTLAEKRLKELAKLNKYEITS